jgi:hypothetical protein
MWSEMRRHAAGMLESRQWRDEVGIPGRERVRL